MQETFARPPAVVVRTIVPRHRLFDPRSVVADMSASSLLASTMLMTLEWYVDVVRYL